MEPGVPPRSCGFFSTRKARLPHKVALHINICQPFTSRAGWERIGTLAAANNGGEGCGASPPSLFLGQDVLLDAAS
jgi:hypothetical protein